MNFSQRYGYKPIRDIIQIESMDEPLRNGLWSLLKLFVWDRAQHSSGMYGGYHLNGHGNEQLQTLCQRLWFTYFKKPLDQLSSDWTEVLEQLRTYFFKSSWHEAYDFIEFVTNNYERYDFKADFTSACNRLLEKEMAGYRLAGGLVTRITEPQELAEIEEAIDSGRGPASQHLRRALELLSDRTGPDYRNSVKESISAVESLVARTVGTDKGTLGQLIKKLECDIGLHPALRTAFTSLYGYTSDESGIRHALTEIDKVDFHDAKFMLVVCSAFVNVVRGKIPAEG